MAYGDEPAFRPCLYCGRHVYREERFHDDDGNECLSCAIGFSLDALRILSGEVCGSCWNSDGEIVPGTEEQSDPWGHVYGHLCERCADREPDHSDFYGGSGPSDQDRFEASRDCGRKL